MELKGDKNKYTFTVEVEELGGGCFGSVRKTKVLSHYCVKILKGLEIFKRANKEENTYSLKEIEKLISWEIKHMFDCKGEPNLVQVFDFHKPPKSHDCYILMERIRGLTLENLYEFKLKSVKKSKEVKEAWRILYQILK